MKNTCCFTGHRPKYFTFKNNEDDAGCILIKSFIRNTCSYLIEQRGVTHFISGGAMGVDTWAMEIVIALKGKYPGITLECALPYSGFPRSFPPSDQERYQRIITSGVDIINEVGERYQPGCMQARNVYMVDRSLYLIAIYTGVNSGTRNTIEYANRRARVVHLYQPNNPRNL